MRSSSKLFMVLVSAAAITGCGIGERSKEARKDAENKWELSGEYSNRCHAPTIVNAILKDDFAKETYDYNVTGTFTQSYALHEDAACSQLKLTRSIGGKYEIVGDSDKVAEAKMVNLTINSATLTPGSDAVAVELNDDKYCGITDWKSGVASNILDKDCGGLTVRNGEVIFDIYKVQDNTLYMGKTSFFRNGSSGSTRPEALDTDLFFTRK